MASPFVPLLDLDLTAHDIQTLNDADALVAFFSRLGYHTNARIIQTAANLGMVAEVVVKPIRRIERIANHEDALQVYLFEVASVTATHTRALARAFRNLVGNYLLVLTSDYESVDFVLLERYVPKEQTQGLGQRQVGIRPRVLTVDRRKPSRLQLRVLRRFTWTEPDPFFQYDKLLAAYAVADWSEEFFNNRALFSDYYLKERLPLSAEWSDDPKPSYIQLRDLYLGAPERFAGQKKLMLRDLVEPVLRSLGFEAKPEKNGARSVIEPDYRLFSSSGSESPIAQCLVYPWGRSLDGKDDRDQETKTENPGAVVVSLLERDGAPWVIVTNGNLWRLYSERTHSRATNYYEIDLNEMLAESGPQAASPGESFRYFWLLFRRRALEPTEIQREGKTVRLSFLDRLLLESEDYAKELGDRLKDRVFEQIFPHLATGFIQHLRQNGESNLSQPVLDRIFEGTLTLLYRLLFLLYAESRDRRPGLSLSPGH